VDPALLEYATPGQARYLEAAIAHGSVRGAARVLGVQPNTVRFALGAVTRAAAARGYSPRHDMTRSVPEPFVAAGVSTYYNKDGVATGQWVKSRLDNDKFEAMKRAAIAALSAEIPREEPVAVRSTSFLPHLLTLYTLTDCHVGMLAWGKETGDDWDLRIAEDTLVGCFAHMVESAPSSRVGFVNQLGDFLHFDGLKAVTPEHGHLLDADGRFEKIVEAAVRILRRVISLALAKHEVVVVLAAEGNHDPSASVWLRVLLAALYENEPRVEVISSPLPYYVYQHGQTMLAFHHGHLTKTDSLPLLMAAQFAVEWGACTKRYAHTGHRHHVEEREHSGITVIQHPTLAARDAYAARGGWHAMRQVKAITYHSRYGQVRTDTASPEMLEAV
jgi:hypothetical protein